MPKSRGRKNKKRQRPMPPDPDRQTRALMRQLFSDLDDVVISDGLDVADYTSSILGTIWASSADEPESGELMQATVLDYLVKQRDAASMAVIASLRDLATSETVRASAAENLERLAGVGQVVPLWAKEPVRVTECWRMSDVFGEQVQVLLVAEGGVKRHGIIAVIEAEPVTAPLLRDTFIVADVDEAIARMRDDVANGDIEGVELMTPLKRVHPDKLAPLLTAAVNNAHPNPDDDSTLNHFWALLCARLRGLGGEVAEVDPEPGKDDIDAMTAEFLDSDAASDLPREPTLRNAVENVVEFHLTGGFRVGPQRTHEFFHGNLPEIYNGEEEELAHMPDVVAAFHTWAAEKLQLSQAARDVLAEQAEACGGHFMEEFTDDPSPDDDLVKYLSATSNGGMPAQPIVPGGEVAGTHQVRIDLTGSKPPIWRRLVLPSKTPLNALHDIIQAAFDWEHAHLHSFEHDRVVYAPPDLDHAEDYTELRLADLAPSEGDKFTYTYDFGDNWEHTIKVEKVDADTEAARVECLAGRRSAPPEDSGGMFGSLEELKEAGMIPEDFDPEHFDRDAVNRKLAAFGPL